MYHIYALVNSLTKEPFYIGITINLVQRVGVHVKDSVRKKPNDKDKYIESLVLSGGFPIITSLKTVDSKDEADLAEVELIKEYKKSYKLYNSTEGGKGTKGFTKVSTLKRAVCKIDMITLKVIETYDSIFSASIENSISASCIGNCCRNKRFSAGKYFWSFETELQDFKPLYEKEKGHDKKRPIIQMSLTDDIIKHFKNMSDAAKETGAQISKICDCCKNKRNTAGGFKWKYKD